MRLHCLQTVLKGKGAFGRFTPFSTQIYLQLMKGGNNMSPVFDPRINESMFDKTDTMNASLQSVIIDNRTETFEAQEIIEI
jgi:hypothetical protein